MDIAKSQFLMNFLPSVSIQAKPFPIQTQKQHRNKFERASHLYFEFFNFLPCLTKKEVTIKERL